MWRRSAARRFGWYDRPHQRRDGSRAGCRVTADAAGVQPASLAMTAPSFPVHRLEGNAAAVAVLGAVNGSLAGPIALA
jgi:hypothetical protein